MNKVKKKIIKKTINNTDKKRVKGELCGGGGGGGEGEWGGGGGGGWGGGEGRLTPNFFARQIIVLSPDFTPFSENGKLQP